MFDIGGYGPPQPVRSRASRETSEPFVFSVSTESARPAPPRVSTRDRRPGRNTAIRAMLAHSEEVNHDHDHAGRRARGSRGAHELRAHGLRDGAATAVQG